MKATTFAMMAAATIGLAGFGATADAAESATATLTLTGTNTTVSPTQYSYAISVNDTGSTTLGTFWYAWVPGQDYMGTSPLAITSPAGWVSAITGGNAGNGYAIQWKASSAASYAPALSTLGGFAFTSLESPAALSGNSPFYPTTPVATSFVYSGSPLGEPGFQFFVTTAPEPTALAIATLPFVFGMRRRTRCTKR